jgi:hypothetical protein
MSDHARNPLPDGSRSTPDPTPKRRVLLFEFTRNDHLYQCELLDHAELGVEARFTKNGEFLEGQLFETLRLAALWADERRKAIETGGN